MLTYLLVLLWLFLVFTIICFIIVYLFIFWINKFLLKSRYKQKTLVYFSLASTNPIFFLIFIVPLFKDIKNTLKKAAIIKAIWVLLIWFIISWFIIEIVVNKVIKEKVLNLFIISWNSHFPTVKDSEAVVINKYSKDFTWWDTVVYKTKTDEFFIKRIIAMWWDELEISDWEVFLKKKWEIEFQILDEPYLSEEKSTQGSEKNNFYKIPEWSFFVMWDNRRNSSDSRTCFSFSCESTTRDEYISFENVVWKYIFHLWYFNIKTQKFINTYNKTDTSPRYFQLEPNLKNTKAESSSAGYKMSRTLEQD